MDLSPYDIAMLYVAIRRFHHTDAKNQEYTWSKDFLHRLENELTSFEKFKDFGLQILSENDTMEAIKDNE